MSNTKSIVKEKIIFDSGKIPYVTASAENNGVMTYINCPAKWIDKGNCIMIGGKTLTFTFQEKNFCSNDSHNIALYAKEKISSEKNFYLFYISAMRAAMQNKYSWGNSISMKKIQEEKIYLPTKDGEIDFEFMEKFITELEAERILELEAYLKENNLAYLTAAGLKNFFLTEEEKFAIENFDTLNWKKFLLKDLFESFNGDTDIQKKNINGEGEFVITAGLTDNGVLGRSDIKAKIFPKNTLTVDMFGFCFYRNFSYKMVTHARVFSLKPKFNCSERAGLFISNSLGYLKNFFGYENMCSWEKIKDFKIYLPTKDGEIDFKFMEKFITAIEKKIIADVVKYSEEKITAYRQVAKK